MRRARLENRGWSINVSTAICRRHQDAVTRIALSDVKEAGINTYTFGGLDFLSDKFATTLSESGIKQGDSVAVMLRPSAALAVAHLGALKTGAIVIPLSTRSEAPLLETAFADSSVKAVVVDEAMHSALDPVARKLEVQAARFVIRDLRPARSSSDFRDFWSEVDSASSDFAAVETEATSPAFIFYVESQGQFTGVVHSHRSVVSQFAAFEMFNNAQPGSVFWTTGDWTSPGVVLGVLYPAWWYGCSVAGTSADGANELDLLRRCEVTHAFLTSSRRRQPAESGQWPGGRSEFTLRTVVVETPRWPAQLVSDAPKIELNAVYGRPETGWILGKCNRWSLPNTRGSVGRPAPGRVVEIIDETGSVLPPKHTGHIAVHKSDPALFIGYHHDVAKTAASFVGDWFVTGDLGYKNEDGDFDISPSPSVVGKD